MLPTGSILPVGGTLRVGELTDPEWDRVWPGLNPRLGELETEPDNSPEWLDSDLLGEGLVGPLRPERDPDELELLLLVVVSPP